jgi:hypothetical protein
MSPVTHDRIVDARHLSFETVERLVRILRTVTDDSGRVERELLAFDATVEAEFARDCLTFTVPTSTLHVGFIDGRIRAYITCPDPDAATLPWAQVLDFTLRLERIAFETPGEAVAVGSTVHRRSTGGLTSCSLAVPPSSKLLPSASPTCRSCRVATAIGVQHHRTLAKLLGEAIGFKAVSKRSKSRLAELTGIVTALEVALAHPRQGVVALSDIVASRRANGLATMTLAQIGEVLVRQAELARVFVY